MVNRAKGTGRTLWHSGASRPAPELHGSPGATLSGSDASPTFLKSKSAQEPSSVLILTRKVWGDVREPAILMSSQEMDRPLVQKQGPGASSPMR